MIVGIDFDNTIVCYDGLFHQAALARQLIPPETPSSKEAVRDAMRSTGREHAWTELQGLVYGQEIHRARPFDGVASFLQRCRDAQVIVHVISHRTRQPFAGPAIDLHAAARGWLDAQDWFNDNDQMGLARDRIYFEETKADKLGRIAAVGCDAFIDDLPELLTDAAFPRHVQGWLFDPHATSTSQTPFQRAGSWRELTQLLLPREDA